MIVLVVCGSGSLCNFVKQRAGGCLCGNGLIVHVHVSEIILCVLPNFTAFMDFVFF